MNGRDEERTDAGTPTARGRPRSAARGAPRPGRAAARDAGGGLDLSGLLAVEWDRLTPREQRTIQRVLRRETVAQDAVKVFEDRRTVGERLADRIAAFGGSWTFILLFFGFLVSWAVINTEILGPRHEAFDPYPYIFLNLMLSMLAAIQAPIIMMAQNRQAARDRFDAAADYAVNLKAELEIQRLHEKMDGLQAGHRALMAALLARDPAVRRNGGALQTRAGADGTGDGDGAPDEPRDGAR